MTVKCLIQYRTFISNPLRLKKHLGKGAERLPEPEDGETC